MEKTLRKLQELYSSVQSKTLSRLNEFRQIRKMGSEKEIFAELVFCLLTPQSRAKTCWDAVKNLIHKNLLLKGNVNRLSKEIQEARFKYKKAGYIVEARKQFLINGKLTIKLRIMQFSDVYDAREWLVQHVKGIAYKEASHFLRNIGLGKNLAILDRHILKNLKLLGVIEEVPGSLSRKRYLEIEKKMKEFAKRIKIPVSHLDLVLWYKETGEIFK